MLSGKNYEKLTKEIFEEILRDKTIETIDVKHDIEIKGRATTHQIDVFWEFSIGGVQYKTIVQAKDWNKPVDQGELLKFKAVLDDIPGQPRGVFVTRTGYQSGALEVAKQNGIMLYELREAGKTEFRGKVTVVSLTINRYYPTIEFVGLLADRAWLSEEKIRVELTDAEEESIEFHGTNDEIQILNEEKKPYMSLKNLLDHGLELDFREIPEVMKEVLVTQPSFIQSNSPKMPLVKIRGVKAKYSISVVSEETEFRIDDFPEYVLKNIVSEEITFFNKNKKKI